MAEVQNGEEILPKVLIPAYRARERYRQTTDVSQCSTPLDCCKGDTSICDSKDPNVT